jgi:hypothetical protein
VVLPWLRQRKSIKFCTDLGTLRSGKKAWAKKTKQQSSRWRSLNKFWGYVAVCVQLYCRWFAVLRLVVAVLHNMFRPTWPSSCMYDVLLFLFLKESASLLLLPCPARGYTMHVFICAFLLFFFSLVSWFLCACFPACLFLLSVCFVLWNIIPTWRWPCRPKHVV